MIGKFLLFVGSFFPVAFIADKELLGFSMIIGISITPGMSDNGNYGKNPIVTNIIINIPKNNTIEENKFAIDEDNV